MSFSLINLKAGKVHRIWINGVITRILLSILFITKQYRMGNASFWQKKGFFDSRNKIVGLVTASFFFPVNVYSSGFVDSAWNGCQFILALFCRLDNNRGKQ